MAKEKVMKEGQIEDLKAKALEELEKVNIHKQSLREKHEELRKQKTLILNGLDRDRGVKSISLNDTTPKIPKSAGQIQDEIVGIKEMLKLDPFIYEEYRKATKDYLTALEPVFDEIWKPILEEKERIREARKQLEEDEETLLDRERDADIQLDDMLHEVGCESYVFPVDHDAYTNRRLFLRRIERFENEASK